MKEVITQTLIIDDFDRTIEVSFKSNNENKSVVVVDFGHGKVALSLDALKKVLNQIDAFHNSMSETKGFNYPVGNTTGGNPMGVQHGVINA